VREDYLMEPVIQETTVKMPGNNMSFLGGWKSEEGKHGAINPFLHEYDINKTPNNIVADFFRR
jgi:hypothetical protein